MIVVAATSLVLTMFVVRLDRICQSLALQVAMADYQNARLRPPDLRPV